ncbi:MAG TPA: hypothetical protein DCQ06_06995, partial [Myxococcales bacterium]|nr:hypothetical protein [Myxococcales bacterium]
CSATQTIMSFPGDGTLQKFSEPVVEQLSAPGLTRPSGLALDRNVLYVGDYATGIIRAYDVTQPGTGPGSFGKLLREFDTKTGPNALVGMTVGPDLRLYAVDRGSRRVIRIDP